MTHLHRFGVPKARQRTPTQKLIAFELEGECYALPIARVVRVLHEFKVYGTFNRGRGLIKYQGETIPLIDLGVLLLDRDRPQVYHYSIICTPEETQCSVTNFSESIRHNKKEDASERFQYIAIPIPELPRVLDVPESQFSDVPDSYRQGNLGSVIEKLIHPSEDDLFFYLNLEQLLKRIEV
ncbi:chemotaxis protein CheW [Lyngbya sp. CCY1209]|uniref:chemotaxis protein CheW n=1 Tax=Lyngbya sp. CCY1209 TaxID=2886103 RepID=UPI002D2149C6|nr:chemotaxis protein CheW [Lyngbya sp. CCY1209]MEB3886802.1 chemotaxis protein CheW [Lyngbya sp. CCY1209]